MTKQITPTTAPLGLSDVPRGPSSGQDTHTAQDGADTSVRNAPLAKPAGILDAPWAHDFVKAATGVEVPSDAWRLMLRHLELVIERNKTVNLTRITGWDEAVWLHVVDSLLLLGAFGSAPQGSFVDVGTGAGFPGIPLAIATGRAATLVDSVGKKVCAVRDFVRDLGLESRVLAEQVRVEDLARRERGHHALVTARAVAQTGILVEYAAPLLRMGGRLVAAKARPADEELATADRVAKVCGLRLVSRETFELPCELGHREVLSYEKVSKARIKLPRAVGMAQHHPLG